MVLSILPFWRYAGWSWFVLVFPGSGSVPAGVLRTATFCSYGCNPACVLCRGSGMNYRFGLCIASGIGFMLVRILCFWSIRLAVAGGLWVLAYVQCCGRC
jgi:hypothetical protein